MNKAYDKTYFFARGIQFEVTESRKRHFREGSQKEHAIRGGKCSSIGIRGIGRY